MSRIDFWFSIGSTYSYLSIMRLADIEAQTGISFDWRPFSVRAIMRETNHIPFADKPAKTAYMWRDIARQAEKYGLSPRLPVPYPLEQFDLANQVAVLGRAQGWCRDYVVATYRKWFEHGEPAGSEPNLTGSLVEIGQDAANIIELANGPEVRNAYAAATEEARARGVFGAPSFIAGGDLFWGDDRLDDAIAWLRRGAQN